MKSAGAADAVLEAPFKMRAWLEVRIGCPTGYRFSKPANFRALSDPKSQSKNTG